MSTKSRTHMTAQDAAILNSIIAFKEKIEYIQANPGYKSGEEVEVDSAVWLMEALFNATYGFPDEQYGQTKTDTTTVFVAVDQNGEVSLDDIANIYDEIKNKVTFFYYSSGFEEKGFLLLDLKKGEIADDQVEIQVRSVTGEKDGDWEPFGDDDYWYYGYHEGNCDMSGVWDAADKIQLALMNTRPVYNPPSGFRFIYTDEEVIDLFGDEYTDESGEFFIFFIEHENGTFNYDETCLIPDEMNYFYDREKTLIYDFLPDILNKPYNWTFKECSLVGLGEVNPTTGFAAIHHRNYLTYALRHLVPISTIDPPIDL